jgi:FAD/FMN-containing dehydrogenase
MTTELRQVINGQVWLPDDSGFQQAAQAWNLAVPQPVAAVVEVADVDDAAALVRYARDAGLGVTVQPRGHGASGNVDGLILVRTNRLDSVEVDPDQQSIRIGAGGNWGALLAEAGTHGLTGLAGSAPGVSVAGFVLGGGLSWFSRKYGWGADSVVSFDIIDADGNQARVTAESDPDLFWALRGGGGDFALVTAIELRLYPERALYGGRITWHGAQAPEVFAAYRELTADAPRELSAWFHHLQIPQAPPMVALDVAYLGDQQNAERLMSGLSAIPGLMSDKRDVLALSALGDITADPTEPGPTKARTELLTGLDDAVVEALLSEPVEPLIDIQLRHLGGALVDVDPASTASGTLTEPYSLHLLGLAFNPAIAQAVTAKQDALVAALKDAVTGRKPYTFLAPGEKAAQAFSEPALARLRELKRARDPHNLFNANFPVLD